MVVKISARSANDAYYGILENYKHYETFVLDHSYFFGYALISKLKMAI